MWEGAATPESQGQLTLSAALARRWPMLEQSRTCAPVVSAYRNA